MLGQASETWSTDITYRSAGGFATPTWRRPSCRQRFEHQTDHRSRQAVALSEVRVGVGSWLASTLRAGGRRSCTRSRSCRSCYRRSSHAWSSSRASPNSRRPSSAARIRRPRPVRPHQTGQQQRLVAKVADPAVHRERLLDAGDAVEAPALGVRVAAPELRDLARGRLGRLTGSRRPHPRSTSNRPRRTPSRAACRRHPPRDRAPPAGWSRAGSATARRAARGGSVPRRGLPA